MVISIIYSPILSQIFSKEGIKKLTFNTRVTRSKLLSPTGNCEDINGRPPPTQKEEIIIILHLGNLLKDIEKH